MDTGNLLNCAYRWQGCGASSHRRLALLAPPPHPPRHLHVLCTNGACRKPVGLGRGMQGILKEGRPSVHRTTNKASIPQKSNAPLRVGLAVEADSGDDDDDAAAPAGPGSTATAAKHASASSASRRRETRGR